MKLDWFKITVLSLLIITLVATVSFGAVLSTRDTGSSLGTRLSNTQRIAILEAKVIDLEKRVTNLESGTTTTTLPATTTTTIKPTTTTSTTTTTLPTTTTTLPTTTTTKPPTTTTLPTTTTTIVFNLQAAINNASAGQTVIIPAGRIAVGTETRLKSGVSLQGAGVGKTILVGNAPAGSTSNLLVGNVSNVGIRDISFESTNLRSLLAIHLYNYSGVTIERVDMKRFYYAIKADTLGSNLTVRDMTADCFTPFYMSNTNGGVFERIVLRATEDASTNQNHALYLERNNRNQVWKDITLSGQSWPLHMYQEGGWSNVSSDISFTNLTVTSTRLAIVIGPAFQNISFYNVNVTAAYQEEGAFTLYDAQNVLVDGFTAKGGAALVSSRGGERKASITCKNGTYYGSRLVATVSSPIDTVFENVSLSN